MCAFAAQVVTDLGGEGELSALERAYVAKLRDLEVTQRLLMADIAYRGLVTPTCSRVCCVWPDDMRRRSLRHALESSWSELISSILSSAWH